MAYQKGNSPFLYDDVTGDIVGFKDPDGSETLFAGDSSSLLSQVRGELASASASACGDAAWFGITTEQPASSAIGLSGGSLTASGITNALAYYAIVGGVAVETNFRYVGCAVGKYGSTFPRNGMVAQINNTSPPATGSITVEFMHLGTQLEVPWYGQSGSIRVCALDADGAEVEVLRGAPLVQTGTAQAGSASGATLAVAASSVDGAYNQQWLYITAGTGIGSFAKITGYVGSTRVATVDTTTGSWVAPDATSTYEVRKFKSAITTPATTGSLYNILITFLTTGPRRIRLVMNGAAFIGVRTSATGDVFRFPRAAARRMFMVGDSFVEGTGADYQATALSTLLARAMGGDPWVLGSGGTGYLNGSTSANSGRLTIVDRIAPPRNSWMLSLGLPTGGTYTLSYGGQTTIALAFNATAATVQAALEALSSVGAGNVVVLSAWNGDGGDRTPVLLRNALAEAAGTLSIASSLTGVTGSTAVARFTGNIAPYVPADGKGGPMPFDIFLLGGHNDTTSSDAGYTPALLQSTLTALVAKLRTQYPTATIWMSGVLYLPGNAASDATTANAALAAAAAASLAPVNNLTPFVDTLSPVQWANGTGNIGTPATLGSSTQLTAFDGIHPSQAGHMWYAARLSAEFLRIRFGS